MKQFGQCRYSASKSRRWNWDKWPERLIQPSTLEFYDLRKCAERLKNIVKTAYRIIGIFHIHFMILQIWGRKAASVHIYIYTAHICTSAQLLSHVWFVSDPMVCSLPGSSVHGISQAKILEWVAISFSKRSFQLRDQICIFLISCIGRRIRVCVCVCVHREKERPRETDFKELTYIIVEAGKSKIDEVGHEPGDPGKNRCYRLLAEFDLSLGKISVFLKIFKWLDEVDPHLGE